MSTSHRRRSNYRLAKHCGVLRQCLVEANQKSLRKNSLKLYARIEVLLVGKDTAGNNSKDLERIVALLKETAMYFYYVATVMELFQKTYAESEFIETEQSGTWDEVARVRQALALNPAVGGELLVRLRSRTQLGALEMKTLTLGGACS